MTISSYACPDCGQLMEIVRTHVLDSTDGQIEHVHVRCVQRHWFLLPAALLETVPERGPRTKDEHPTPAGVEARKSRSTGSARR